jgi:preprotein translocase SecE subunit
MVHQRYVLFVFVLAAMLSGSVLQAGLASAFVEFGVADQAWLGGVVSTSDALSLSGALLTFFALLRQPQAVRFTDEAVGELRKVTWPTRDEALSATSTVIFTALFVAALIGVYDLVWSRLAKFILYTDS